tara:strand:- start:1098 stop:1223 length:126 start_codon:yes stop_codon:yes gene_type:complete
MELFTLELSPLSYTLLFILSLALASIAHKGYQVKKSENKPD